MIPATCVGCGEVFDRNPVCGPRDSGRDEDLDCVAWPCPSCGADNKDQFKTVWKAWMEANPGATFIPIDGIGAMYPKGLTRLTIIR